MAPFSELEDLNNRFRLRFNFIFVFFFFVFPCQKLSKIKYDWDHNSNLKIMGMNLENTKQIPIPTMDLLSVYSSSNFAYMEFSCAQTSPVETFHTHVMSSATGQLVQTLLKKTKC